MIRLASRCSGFRSASFGLRSAVAVALPLATAVTVCSAATAPDTLRIDSVLAVERGAPARRSPVFTDAVERLLVSGQWHPPREGDRFTTPEGEERIWSRIEANGDGWLEGDPLEGGYAHASITCSRAGVYLLDARGHRHVYVNGVPRGGDVYDLGFVRVPIELRSGSNELLFRAGRGRLRASIVPATGDVFIESRDMTLPDVIRSEESDTLHAGIVVTNATTEWQRRLAVTAGVEGAPPRATNLAPLPPVSGRKVPIAFAVANAVSDTLTVEIQLLNDGRVADRASVALQVKDPTEPHVRTFLSEIDGSVQYYAVNPPAAEPDSALGLVLTLHGAAVRAENQARAYQPRGWCVIVAPTNRRPFGFDWEDWGRMDALEVLDLAQRRFATDPRRTWLTGHSMGGHGVWNLGAHFPDRFAALGPCAAWRDFWSYAGGAEWENPDPIEVILARSANTSRTLLLERNYSHGGVYIFHGEADDNVPVHEARFMRERLGTFHANFAYLEYPQGTHWWGNESADWPPMMEFLRRNTTPETRGLHEITFTTVNPAVSSSCFWVSLETQLRSMDPSTIRAIIEQDSLSLTIETENVAGMAIDLAAAGVTGSPITLDVDGRPLGPSPISLDDPVLRLVRNPDWTIRRDVEAPWKGPYRAGPFKEAFRNRMVFVFGTRGTAAENAWSFAKARYDAETFHYRGNGAVEILRDVDFRPERFRDRNVILYGNADTNAAWRAVLDGCPIDVRRTHVRIGDREIVGEDLACLFTYPRRGSDSASVAVIAGTGLPGSRLTNQLPYFVSGIAYPDWIVIGAEMLERGSRGVRAAGFFGPDWTLDGDSAWR